MTQIQPANQPPTGSLQPRITDVAPCPGCNAASASPVSFTWWGGVLGPKIFHVVACGQCQLQYNGKTGARLTRAIVTYSVVAGVVAIGLFAAWLAVH